MDMSENANMVQLLQAIGRSDSQITNFLLGVRGRISIEEAVRIHKEKEAQK